MAISIITQPGSIVGVKHPVLLELQTNNYLVDAGTKASIRINVSGTSNDQAFTFKIAGQLYTFTAKTTPDANDGFQYFANVDPIEVCNELGAMFNALPFFADNYIFTSNGTSWVQLEAKVAGQNWDHNFNAGTTSFTPSITTNGVNPSYRPNFKMLVWLTVGVNQIALNARVDANNRAQFRLEESLEALAPSFLPEIEGGVLQVWETDLLFAYSLSWAEQYGEIPVAMRRTSANYKAAPGFYSKTQYPALKSSFIGSQFTNTSNRRFYTHMPRTLVMKPQQDILLYLYNDGSKGHIDYRGRALKANAEDFLLPWVEAQEFSVESASGEHIIALSIPIYEYLNVLFGGWQDVVEFDLGISLSESNSGPYHHSEYIRVILDRSAQSVSEMWLLFKSQAGVLEKVYFEGDLALSTKSSRTLGETTLQPDYSLTDGEVQVVRATRQREWTLNSGLRDRDYIVWLQELTGSEAVFLNVEGQGLTRVIITSSSHDLTETNQELFSMKLTVQEAFINE